MKIISRLLCISAITLLSIPVSAQQVSGKISSLRVSVTDSLSQGECSVSGQIEIQTSAPRIKSPVAVLYVLLKDNQGGMTHRAFLLNDQSKSSAEGQNGRCIGRPKYELAAEKSAKAVEIDSKSVAKENFSSRKMSMFLHVSKKKAKYSLYLYRAELWFDGKLLSSDSNSSEILLKNAGLPNDWYKYEAYPSKITYQDGYSWDPW